MFSGEPSVWIEQALCELEDLSADALIDAKGRSASDSARSVAAYYRAACKALELCLEALDRVEARRNETVLVALRPDLGTRERRAMSPEQCREARELLQWTRQELARAADVPSWVIAAFESGKEMPEFLASDEGGIQRTFEKVGIGFLFEIADGRIRGAGVTYSPRGKSETH